MKNGLVIADAGPIFSLALIGKLDLLEILFEQVKIPTGVWIEITQNPTTPYYPAMSRFFADKVQEIKGFNELAFVMDYGESEAVVLYKELGADFLLIDDRKARQIAENTGIQCIGTLGLLSHAKEKGWVPELKPLFETFLANNRYYAIALLNEMLAAHQEPLIN